MMSDNTIPLNFIAPEVSFNLDLDTNNRLAKVQSEIKLPTNDITLDNKIPQYFPEFKPSFDFEKNEVKNGKNIYEAAFSKDPEEAAKARQLIDDKQNQSFNVANDLYAPTYTPIEQTKRYTSEKEGFIPGTDNEDYFYNQNWASKGFVDKAATGAWNTLGRVATGAVLKFGSGFGYMGSMLGNIGQDDYWGKVADNGFSKAMDQAEEFTKQELFRVYKSANYDNKGFFGKLTDASFWQDDMADGFAFMASAMIPMGAFGQLGTAAKFGRFAILAEDLAATTRVGKAAQAVFGATRGAQITEGVAAALEFTTGSKNILGVAGHLYSTASEAAFEATDRYKQARKQGLSAEEAGKQASQTFGYNMAILSFSNAFENKLVQKVLNRNKEGAFKTAMNFGDDLGVNVDKAGTKFGRFLQDNTWGKRMSFYGKQAGKQAGKGILAEGWEENAQLAAQRIAEGEYDAKEVGTGAITKKKAGNFIEQLATQTLDAFQGNDNEAGTSIGIGSLIGVLGGVGTSLITRERSKKEANTLKAITEYNTARNNWLKNDVYETYDDNGTTKYKLDENKKLVIDPLKVAAREEKIAEMTSKLNLAKNTEIPNLKSYLERSAFTDFTLAHINNDSIDFLIDRLDNWDNSDKETLAAYGFSQDLQEGVSPKKFAEIARDLKKIHSSTQDIRYEKPQGNIVYDEKKKVAREMTNEEAMYNSELAKQKVFELQADAYHVSAILNEGFNNLSDEKYRNVNNLTSTIQNSVELIDVLKGKNGVDVAFKDLLEKDKIALTSYLKDSKNKDVVNEYAKIKKEQLDLTNSYNNIVDQIDLYSDTKTGLKDAAIELIQEAEKKATEVEKNKPKEEPEVQKPIFATVNGIQYETKEDLDKALTDGIITTEEHDNAIEEQEVLVKEDLGKVILNKDNKYQIQIGEYLLNKVYDTKEQADEVVTKLSNLETKEGKYDVNLSGLTAEQQESLIAIKNELNKVKTPEKKEEALPIEAEEIPPGPDPLESESPFDDTELMNEALAIDNSTDLTNFLQVNSTFLTIQNRVILTKRIKELKEKEADGFNTYEDLLNLFGETEPILNDIEKIVATDKNYNSWSNIRDRSDYRQFIDQIQSTLALFGKVQDKSQITLDSVDQMLSTVKAFQNGDIRETIAPMIVEKYGPQETTTEPEILTQSTELDPIDTYNQSETETILDQQEPIEEPEEFIDEDETVEDILEDITIEDLPTFDYDIVASFKQDDLLAIETPAKTTGQAALKDGVKDVIVKVKGLLNKKNEYKLKVLNTNTYDQNVNMFLQELYKNELYQINLRNGSWNLTLTKDTKQWQELRGIEEGMDLGMVMIIKDTEGNIISFDDVQMDQDGPVILTVNDTAFDTDIRTRAIYKAQRDKTSVDDVMAYYEQVKKDLSSARQLIINGNVKEVKVSYLETSPGISNFNLTRVVGKKEPQITPYKIIDIIKPSDFDIILNVKESDTSFSVGRPYIKLDTENSTVEVGTTKLSQVKLSGNLTVLNHVKDLLSNTYANEDDLREAMETISLLSYQKAYKLVGNYKDDNYFIKVVNKETNEEIPIDTFEKVLDKAYLNINAKKIDTDFSFKVNNETIDYLSFIKSNLTSIELPMIKDKENPTDTLSFQGINGYINFELPETTLPLQENETMETEVKPKTKRKSKAELAKEAVKDLGKSNVIVDVNTPSIKNEDKTTECK